MCSEQYGLFNIELTWMGWGLLKSNEHSEYTILWKNLSGYMVSNIDFWILN